MGHQRLLSGQDGRHSGRAGGGARHRPGLPVPVTGAPYWPTAALRSPEDRLLAAVKAKPSTLVTVPTGVCVTSSVCVCVSLGVTVCVCVYLWVFVCVCVCVCECVCVIRPPL